MADGWNKRRAWRVWVSVATWDDPWFYSLPDDKQRLAWLWLITPPHGNKSGIFEVNSRRACDYLRIRKSRLRTILEGFERDGKVELELSYCWVINFVEFQNYSGSARGGVVSDLDNYVTCAPKLVQHWHDRYPGYTEGVPKDDPGGTPLNHLTTEPLITKENKGDPVESHPLFDLVSELKQIINESCVGGKQYQNPIAKSIKMVDQANRLDKIPLDDFKPMLKWALTHDFWSDVIRSIPAWRKNNSGNPKIYNCWTRWKQDRSPAQSTDYRKPLEMTD